MSVGRKGRGESSAVGSGAVPFPVLPVLCKLKTWSPVTGRKVGFSAC